MLRCFGLDPAWSDRHPSGLCVLDGEGRLLEEATVEGDDAIVGFVTRHLSGPAIIAADIPLVVRTEAGARPCDRQVAAAYGSRWAAPHPANRSLFLRRYGRIRGEDLAARFATMGFRLPETDGERVLIEVYPHPGLVEVFDLPRRLAYKKGTVAQRAAGVQHLAALLGSLADADPPLVAPPLTVPAGGRALKRTEDLLDARFCAWTALVWAVHGTGGVTIFGDPGGEHIGVTTLRTSGTAARR
jgi:predicted RNase H-like nuclease